MAAHQADAHRLSRQHVMLRKGGLRFGLVEPLRILEHAPGVEIVLVRHCFGRSLGQVVVKDARGIAGDRFGCRRPALIISRYRDSVEWSSSVVGDVLSGFSLIPKSHMIPCDLNRGSESGQPSRCLQCSGLRSKFHKEKLNPAWRCGPGKSRTRDFPFGLFWLFWLQQ